MVFSSFDDKISKECLSEEISLVQQENVENPRLIQSIFVFIWSKRSSHKGIDGIFSCVWFLSKYSIGTKWTCSIWTNQMLEVYDFDNRWKKISLESTAVKQS